MKPADDPTHYPRAVWNTTEHDYVKTRSDSSPETELHKKIKDQEEHIARLQKEVSQLGNKVISLDSVTGKSFQLWTNLPNRDIFNHLVEYLRLRGGEELKYWRGKNTQRHEHFKDKGLKNKPGRNRSLSFEEELFLVFVKLKTGFNNCQLEHLFGISDSMISQIFTTHINFLEVELKLLFEMPEVGREGTAECYKQFPNLKVVLDCTEIRTQRSRDLRARKELYSHYKGNETMKFMVGLAPNLCVNYVSKGYGGRASDRKITLESPELLSALTPGSAVMSDRGFNLSEELKELGVELIIPDFKGRDRSQLTRGECESSENIAKARIHVERIIQRIRTFHILGHTALLSMKDIMQQVFTVCAYLTNFQLPIVR